VKKKKEGGPFEKTNFYRQMGGHGVKEGGGGRKLSFLHREGGKKKEGEHRFLRGEKGQALKKKETPIFFRRGKKKVCKLRGNSPGFLKREGEGGDCPEVKWISKKEGMR